MMKRAVKDVLFVRIRTPDYDAQTVSFIYTKQKAKSVSNHSPYLRMCSYMENLLSLVTKTTLTGNIAGQTARFATQQVEPSRMEKTLNEVTLLGRVGGEPQKRGTEEHPVVIFSLATHTNYKYDTGEFVQRTDWHRICVFKPTLRDTVYAYLKKGQRVYVSGRLTYGEIKDEAGNPRTTTAIVADDVIFFQTNDSS